MIGDPNPLLRGKGDSHYFIWEGGHYLQDRERAFNRDNSFLKVKGGRGKSPLPLEREFSCKREEGVERQLPTSMSKKGKGLIYLGVS